MTGRLSLYKCAGLAKMHSEDKAGVACRACPVWVVCPEWVACQALEAAGASPT